jgi:hypothetical protein
MVKTRRQLVLGKTLVVLGCLCFLLVLLQIRPLFLLLFLLLTRVRPPAALGGALDVLLTLVYGAEYIAALAAVACGAMVWRHAQVHRWPIKPVLAVVTLSLVGVGIRQEVRYQAQKRRAASYETTLRSYGDVLKPGMSRKEVEDYLRAKNTRFTQMCCVEAETSAERSSWDDLVKIGNEDAPWFCGAKAFYIAFQFIDYERQGALVRKDNDLDTLKSVTVYPMLEDCL